MNTIIIILVFIIIILITYLFFLKKDLIRIRKNMKTIHETGSNNTVHSEIDCRELNELIDEII